MGTFALVSSQKNMLVNFREFSNYQGWFTCTLAMVGTFQPSKEKYHKISSFTVSSWFSDTILVQGGLINLANHLGKFIYVNPKKLENN